MQTPRFIKKIFRREKDKLDVVSPDMDGSAADRLAELFGFNDPLCVAAVYRCVRLISDSIASMPVEYQRRVAGVFEPWQSHPYYDRLTVEPNANTGAHDFWAMAVSQILCDGVAYILPDYSEGNDVTFELLPPGVVNPVLGQGIYNINAYAGNAARAVAEADIIVLRCRPVQLYAFTAPVSESVTKYSRRSVNLSLALDSEATKRVRNGGQTRIILSGANEQTGVYGIGGSQLTQLADLVEKRFDAGRNVVPLPGDIKATQLGATAADMQLQAMREFAVKEICRFFGVPPTFVFSDSSSNYKSVEMAQIDFLTNTLDPIMSGIENELNRKLIPRAQRRARRFRFDRQARHNTDLDTRARYLLQMLQMGALTPNEIRADMGRQPVDGGDSVMVSTNLQRLNLQDNATQPTTTEPE